MSVKVKYKGEEILSINTDGEEALATQGQYCEADIIIENTQDGDVGGDYNIEAVDDGNGGQILNITDAEGGGGGSGYEMHTINFTLAAANSVWDILPIYTDECSDWVIYPADASNTALNTIAVGTWWRSGHQYAQGFGRFKDIVTPIGVTIPDLYHSYYVNDQTYNILRVRGNVIAKPAGDYVLKFYGIAK